MLKSVRIYGSIMLSVSIARRIIMKATKKFLSIALAIVVAGLALIMPISASSADLPVIVVDGIGTTPLYQNFDTDEEKLVFDDATIEALIKDGVKAFVKGANSDADYAKFASEFMPVVNKYIEPIAYNLDGTPKDTTIGFYQYEFPLAAYTEEEQKSLFPEFTQIIAKKYGNDNTYNFSYDWRADPVDNAFLLAEYIENVKAATGAKRVNIVSMSLGTTVVLAYLNFFGGSSINNCVFASGAWQGTSIVGNLLTKNLCLDAFTLENYLVQMGRDSFTTHVFAFAISYLATDEGLTEEYIGDLNDALNGLLPYLFADTFVPNVAGMPGLWALCPQEDYDAGIASVFSDVAITPALKDKIDVYHQIQHDAERIINDAMAEGMRFSIVAGYNSQIVPISDEFEQSDSVIDTKYMSGGATCAQYLKAFDDWGNIYSQENQDEHNHVSWDYKVDASTCMFPEQTWLIKNLTHGYAIENGTVDILIWLLQADAQPTVHTDPANYPQFILYNTYKRKLTPIDVRGMIGDIDGSGAIRAADAILALQMAAGQIAPTEEQLVLGDIDEDGSISIEDAREILYMATGIY